MNIHFSPSPGPYERHLKRRMHNPLFSQGKHEYTQHEIDEARQKDEAYLLQFMEHFQSVVKKTTELGSHSESEIVLQLKEQLDECYATCCAMPGDHTNLKTAITKLIDAIMTAIRKGAENDPVALQKLDEEDIARQMHNELHNRVLIADLMLENSPILEDELTPTLLYEESDDLDAALQLFSPQQLKFIYQDAQTLLEDLRKEGHELPQAWERFQQIKQALDAIEPVTEQTDVN